MNNVQRILGIFAASAAMGLGMAGCDNSQSTFQKSAQGTLVTVYPQGLVRERVSRDLTIGADFKQNIYFKTMIFSGWQDNANSHDNSTVTTTIQIPFADIKDQETLDKIAYLKTFYDQAMRQKPAVAAPTPK